MKKTKKYVPRPGCTLSKKDALLLAIEFEKIRSSGNKLTKELIVKVASRKSHPLHKFFQWDDEKAASTYRLQQARNLFSMVMEIEVTTGRPVRSYYPVVHYEKNKNQTRRWYETRSVIVDNDNCRTQISFERYSTILGLVRDVESLGLDKEYDSWRRICLAVNQNPIETMTTLK